ncbi:MAG: UDP-3-O-(3-hydroxymyristoyl)glucosamine N-acyltransferase [Hyphomicrobiales bacterium]|nr:UDP-3-O-(3-hydroxymyristoyl)glucosamine N-acyltransferase [Hyphomicrobiales bacterium]
MEHPGFFEQAGPFTLADIASKTDAELVNQDQGDRKISDIAPLSEAKASDLTFVDNVKYLSRLAETQAGACFIHQKHAPRCPEGVVALLTSQPYRSYAKALSLFYPDAGVPKAAFHMAGAAQIDPTARIESGVIVEPGAVIGPEARIGAGTRVAAGAVIGYRCAVGRHCYVGARAVITHTLMGNDVIVHAGVAIGQDGFGFAMGPQGHLKVPQIGRVIIQDNVEIGANSTIDRGALRDTIIGEGTKIDNLVQIGHNVVVGRNAVLVAQAGVSGSTVLEDFVVMGGQSGVVGHIRIGAGAQIAGNSGVASSIPPGERWGGTPARPVTTWARETALLKRLTEKLGGKGLKVLEKLIG